MSNKVNQPNKVIVTFYSKGIPVEQGTYPITISSQTILDLTDIIKQEYDDVTLSCKYV